MLPCRITNKNLPNHKQELFSAIVKKQNKGVEGCLRRAETTPWLLHCTSSAMRKRRFRSSISVVYALLMRRNWLPSTGSAGGILLGVDSDMFRVDGWVIRNFSISCDIVVKKMILNVELQ
jgi:hypothetical protein